MESGEGLVVTLSVSWISFVLASSSLRRARVDRGVYFDPLLQDGKKKLDFTAGIGVVSSRVLVSFRSSKYAFLSARMLTSKNSYFRRPTWATAIPRSPPPRPNKFLPSFTPKEPSECLDLTFSLVHLHLLYLSIPENRR